jgi:hypothetical protein
MNFTKIENGKRVINNDAILNFTDEMYSQYQLDTTKEVPFISRLYNLIEAVILELKIFKKAQNSLPNKQVWEESSGMSIELEWSDSVLRIHFKKGGVFKEICSISFSTADIQKLCLGRLVTVSMLNKNQLTTEHDQMGLKAVLEKILTQVRCLWEQK